MSVENAQKFLEQMREDIEFRNQVQDSAENYNLKQFLEENDLKIDINELAIVMSKCMESSEQ